MNDITLKINDKEVKAKEGMTILEAARSNEIFIPTLCYHEKLAPYGACRLCMVEIMSRGRSRLVVSCVYPVEDGLEVKTESERVIKIRKMLLEMMLAQAPRVRAIEDYAIRYGVSKTRFEIEPTFCILCGLCVRYCTEIKKKNAVGFIDRGTERQVMLSPDIAPEECMNCRECFSICPTSQVQLITMPESNLNRVSMPKQAPEARARNFNEVALGYTGEQAIEEANRCLQCPEHPCTDGCPVGVNIPDFIRALRDNDMPEAVRALKSENNLPAICGRVCPQESQCEAACAIARKDAPVAIGRLERYVADWEHSQGLSNKPPNPSIEPSGKRVAVVGAGPAGLTAAADLVKLGHEVTIFEALHVAGGVLMYGIPEFRLPKEIVQAEVEYVKSLGVEIRLDSVVGKIATVDELLEEGYDAVFLGTGAGLPMFLDVPGENLNGIYSSNEYLTRINLMKAYLFPEYDTPIQAGKRVAVIGGGNVAMDSARCALRLGAKQVYIVYRRSRVEMPARAEEVENAEEEGIIFKLLTNPVAFFGDGRGCVAAMGCVQMELGEPDASGRRRPIPKTGSEFIIEVDTVVIALGTTPNPLVATTTKGLEITRRGTVVADEETGKTSKDRVWAGGDIVTGAATVISAMGAGKRAAASMDDYLRGSEAA